MNATTAADERTCGQWAERAEQAVRVLNHRTRPGGSELTDPAEAADVIATLASLTAMLPQLLDQLAGWLGQQQQAGRLRVDSLAALPDAGQTVQAAIAALTHAGQCARQAGHAIDTAHQHAAHLAADNDGDADTDADDDDDDDDDGWCDR
jgi:hypothetical protein